MNLKIYNKQLFFFDNKFIIILDQIILSGSNFIVSYILAKHLSYNEFGLYNLFIAIVMFVLSISNALLFQPYQLYKHDNNYINKESLLITTLLLICLSQMLCILYLLITKNINMVYLIGFTSYITFFILHEMNRRIFLERELYKKLLGIDILAYLTRLFFLYVVLFKIKDINMLFYFLGISFFISFLFSRNHTLKKININSFKEYFRLGKWLLGSAIIYWISTQLNIFFLAYETSVRNVGVFSALLIPFGLIRIIQTAGESFLLSRLSKKYKEKKSSKNYLYDFLKEIKFFYIIIVMIYIIMYLFDNVFLHVFYENKFDNFIFLFDLLILYSFFQSNIFFISVFFKVTNKTKELYFINKKVLLLTFPIIVILIHLYGLNGLINGLILMSLLNFVFIIRRSFHV